MSVIQSTPTVGDVHQVLASAVAHHIERLSKEEVQALVTKAQLDLLNENTALKQRIATLEAEAAERANDIKNLEAEKIKLYYRIARLEFDEKEYENFDPSEYTVPVEEMLENARRRLTKT